MAVLGKWPWLFPTNLESVGYGASLARLVSKIRKIKTDIELPKPILADVTSVPEISNVTDMVKMPDMFVSWAAEPPRVSPYYEEVKLQADRSFKK